MVLLLTAFSSLGQSQEKTQGKQGDAATQQKPAQKLPIPLPVKIISDKSTTEARERREAETSQREKDDLVAQQGMNAATQAMNKATQDMAFYSKLSTIFVGIGTVLLIWTLWLTWGANKAAVGAVDATREVGQAQLRAYLRAEVTSGTIEINKPVIFNVAIENYGATPANNVSVASCLVVRNKDWSWDDESTPSGKAPNHTIHPRDKYWSILDIENNPPLGEKHYEAIKSGVMCIFGLADISYVDVFGTFRKTVFCIEFSGSECFNTGNPRVAWVGNKST